MTLGLTLNNCYADNEGCLVGGEHGYFFLAKHVGLALPSADISERQYHRRHIFIR